MKLIVDAYIPARSGSTRVIGKNIRLLAGHPLIAYTIAAAIQSGIFRHVIVTSDSVDTLDIAVKYGAKGQLRSAKNAETLSMDIDWLREVVENEAKQPEYFAILRPTSPFRQPETIRQAWRQLQYDTYATGLKAVSPVCPGKMWVVDGLYMEPLLSYPRHNGQPAYNCPTQVLPVAWKQNSSLDMGLVRNITIRGDIYGAKIIPFHSPLYEDVNIDEEVDFLWAEFLVEKKIATLPII